MQSRDSRVNLYNGQGGVVFNRVCIDFRTVYCKWLFIYLHLPRKLFGGVELILTGLMDGPGVIFFLVVGQETNK